MAAAEELDKLRSRTGITAETLQGFQAAGDVAGNTLEQIAARGPETVRERRGGQGVDGRRAQGSRDLGLGF